MSKPLIAVVGATGLQGGSVVSFLQRSNAFRIRGLTRNANSPAAKALAEKGVDVRCADLDDIKSLREAFRGCDGVFGVTNCWEHGWDAETRQGINMVDAAKAEGVGHFVWSTMEHSGDLEIWHFDSKAAVNDHLIQSGIPYTMLFTAAYYENFSTHLSPQRDPEGFYTLDFNAIPPDTKFFAFSGGEIGAWVTPVFLQRDNYVGETLRLVADWLTVRDMASTASKVTGLDVRPAEGGMERLEKTREGGIMAEDLYRMTMYYIQHPPESGVRDEEETRRIFPQASKWEDFVKANRDKIFT